MIKTKCVLLALLIFVFVQPIMSQRVQISKEQLIALTPEWKGERFPDGRPKVPDKILQRMKAVSVEEAWAVMKNAGYAYQIAEGWLVINPDSVLVGRKDFSKWLNDHINELPVAKEQIQEYLKERTW